MKQLLPLFLLLLCYTLHAQWAEPMKWGRLNKAKEAESSTLFSDAAAVIVSDYGVKSVQADIDGIYKYSFTHHRRIKVQRPADFDVSQLDLYYEPDLERLSKLRVQLLFPSARPQKIPPELIKKEKLDDNWSVIRFDLPKLPEGVIIEYRYQLTSTMIERLRNWYFQGALPVLRSEVRLKAGYDLPYRAVFKSAETVTDPSATTGLSVDFRRDLRAIRYQFVMENQPALEADIYTTTIEDYYAQLQFHLERIKDPFGSDMIFFKDWDTTADSLRSAIYFGNQYQDSTKNNKWIEAAGFLLEKDISEWEMIELLYQFVNKELSWNGEYSLFSTGNINELLTTKTGNSTELNLVLLALLRKAGIQANPLLVSTRSNGKINSELPLYNQFNHMLVSVEIEKELLLLDAGNPLRPLGIPRMDALNGYGWIVEDSTNSIVKTLAASTEETVQAKFVMDTLGILSGHLQSRYKGYAAIAERNNLMVNPAGSHWYEQLTLYFPRLRIDSLWVKHQEDPQLPLERNVRCKIYDAFEYDNELLLLKPALFSQFYTNPLSGEQRYFPVDMPSPVIEQSIFYFTIPSGYKIISIPETANYKLPGNGGSFQFLSSQRGNRIQIISKIKINETLFSVKDYPGLKQFFELIENKLRDNIVIAKQESEP